MMKLVYDGGTEVHVPIEMCPAGDFVEAGQLQGCWFENLAELAGRVCYDSLGSGRNSADYHQHIQDVGHLSVYEHCVFCIDASRMSVAYRPGMYWNKDKLWFNLRTMLEWDTWTGACGIDGSHDEPLYAKCYNEVMRHEPKFIRLRGPRSADPGPFRHYESGWRTYYVRCSRACSHELVRHGDFTAISQRSTRYCIEDLNFENLHPLLRGTDLGLDFLELADKTQAMYEKVFTKLVGEKHSLKQARGAARQVLPHYLTTELIFSASGDQWERIKKQRVSDAADAEIRELIMSM